MSDQRKDDDFFVGYAPEMPAMDRRFFMGAGIALTLGSAGLAGAVAAAQRAVGPGQWDLEDKDWTGTIVADPYPALITRDIEEGTVRTAFLACSGKCGVRRRLTAMEGGPATVRGSLIHRGRHAMLSVVDGPDWIAPAPEATNLPPLPERERLTDLALDGMILDLKCWFGAMRPAEGKVHKACATLCIRGGIPAGFYARDRDGNMNVFVLTQNGQPVGHDILPLVADPVRITGQAYAMGDALFLDVTEPEGIRRI